MVNFRVLFLLVIVMALSFAEYVATLFGQLWRLEPLRSEKKAMWRREIEWFLSVSDHIVELTPNWQTFPDGSKLEVPNFNMHLCLMHFSVMKMYLFCLIINLDITLTIWHLKVKKCRKIFPLSFPKGL